jgi:hypothetical protein
MTTIYTDRSRIETAQRCARLRYLEYHAEGIGLTSAKKPLPLAVGGAVHKGLESLLTGFPEDDAVSDAINDLAQYRGALALDPYETSQSATPAPIPDDQMRQQLADSLGVTLEEANLLSLQADPTAKRNEFDEYLWQEQSALVEGMVRAYARRRLKPLLEEFEVLEVEREGEWTLAYIPNLRTCYESDELSRQFGKPHIHEEAPSSIVFMSRPDALLRSRLDHNLYLLSYKTAASWDYRKAKDAEHDMQGLSEGVEPERRLGERIMGIRYEYLLKGDRWKDKDLTSRFGFDCRSQRSHLIRQYVAESVPQSKKGPAPFNHGDLCWSWEYLRDDGTEGKLAWQNWKSRPVPSVRDWINALDDSQMQMSQYDSTIGMEPREMGWKSRAQAMGTTTQHPLDAVFIPPITIYRNEDESRDWLEQIEAQEKRIAEAVAQVVATSDEDERRSLLNQHFPMSRRACEYPSTCAFTKVCYGGDDIRRDPLASELYKKREPHHTAELESKR